MQNSIQKAWEKKHNNKLTPIPHQTTESPRNIQEIGYVQIEN